MKHFKKVSLMLAVLCMWVGCVLTVQAANGPNTGEYSAAYINIYDRGGTNTNHFVYVTGSQKAETVKGAVYDKKTNTLTLTNYKHPTMSIEANEMGDDFKIKLVGDNQIKSLIVWGYGYGGSVEILGDGTLTINKNKGKNCGITMQPEGTKAVLKVSGKAVVDVYAGTDKMPFYVNSISEEYKNCVDADTDKTLKTEAAYTDRYITHPVVWLSDEPSVFEVYMKDGDAKSKYAIDMYDTSYYIYKLIYCKSLNLYYAHEIEHGYSAFNPFNMGYYKTLEEISAYTYRGKSSGEQEYIEDKTGKKCIFELDIKNGVTSYVKCDLISIGSITDSTGEAADWYIGQPSSDNVVLTKEEWYNLDKDGSGYTASYVREPIKGYVNIYVSGTSYHLTAKKTTGCEHKEQVQSVKKKATFSADGKLVTKCKSCGETLSTKKINKISNVKLSKSIYTYDKKAKKPTVTVKDTKGKKLKKGKDYTVTYAKGRKAIGNYKVTIQLKGKKYNGKETLTFRIAPAGTSIKSAKAGKTKVTVNWKKQTRNTSGYIIQYSANKSFRNVKQITISSNKAKSKQITKLSTKKQYYVRICTYKNVKKNGKTTKICSDWSNAVAVKTK
ncbi:fibronectin type III domain-containing protein [Clostridium sp. AF15-41]|uniref:fibronectin type III domain-containing protein n=1 Tax=Clostridium sp. AF15-41 TaxID=2292996 RepID=UPI0014034DA9|nr:fibronectin type III domain-containing protein [Clostridium sp. AF15-41]